MERVRDVEYRRAGERAWTTLSALDARPAELGMKTFKMKNGVLYYASFDDLGIDVPGDLGRLKFALVFSPNPPVGQFVEPGKIKHAPDGMIMIGIKSSPAMIARSQDASVASVVKDKKKQFMHELVHAFDLLTRDGSMLKNAHADNEAGRYWDSEHEINAYLHESFEKLVQEFFMIMGKNATKIDAEAFAPSGRELWDRFVEAMHTTFRLNSDVDRLMRRWIPRVIDMWDDFITTLPDE